ncbi:major capsid protein [Actinomyces sp. HMT897]|uniref:major capsid protein n=1 Tax=Actinomyces sp. HMT897 TaxID=2789424 RepID=UPI00190B27D2|nr:hypothetical protein [Actinomyces sp. HMT897]QQO78158.1 hypothetical protein JJJ15_01980 [Actinomyces sp. HMT897]DAR87785.1 MAG TPA: major capsid protein [Caudoviricetes sp.]
MSVTLEQAKLSTQDDIDLNVIDEFRTNPVLDRMVFDDCVNPAGGGATLTYGYTRIATTRKAAFRAVNEEYMPSEVTRKRYVVDLKPLGGSFQIDRVIANLGPAASGEITLQMSQLIKATQAKFGDAVVNGDSTKDVKGFDGLAKALKGSSTEDTTEHDWTGAMDTTKALSILTDVDDLLSRLDSQATLLLGSRKVIQLVKAASRFANQYVEHVGPRDTALPAYAGAVLVDAGLKDGSAEDVIPVTAGVSALYAVRIGLDGFHAVSTSGTPLVRTWMPDFSTSGAVKTGEVELGPVAVVLKASKAAGVLTNIKVGA